MSIEAHIVAWNEDDTIHLSIKHYQAFCSRIIIWDNHSTDNTQEIAKAMGCVVKTFGKPGELSDRALMELKNECWKSHNPGQDRRDFVIVVDADEILFVDKYQFGLNRNLITLFKPIGWQVMSYDMPKEDWLEITYGHKDENYSKVVMFDPKKIREINYHIGAHVCSPKGEIVWLTSFGYLMHYRNVGGPQRLVDRHKLYRERLSEENKTRGFGKHYTWDDETRVREWQERYEKSKPFSLAGIGG